MNIHSGPAPSFGKTLLEIRIPSEFRWMTPLAVRLAKKALEEGLIREEERESVEACSIEALKNAITHGNHEDSSKWVLVRLFQDGEEWGISFQDEGQGFAEDRIPDPAAPDLPWSEQGRGIHFMRAFMSRIEYYSGGRILVLWRECDGSDFPRLLTPTRPR